MGAKLLSNRIQPTGNVTGAGLGLEVGPEALSVSGVGMSAVSSLSIAMSNAYGAGNRRSLMVEPNTSGTYIRFTPTVDYAYGVFYQYRNSTGSSYSNNVAANTAVNKGYPFTINAGRHENYKIVIQGGGSYFSGYGLTPAICIDYWFNSNSSPVYMREIITLGTGSSGSSIVFNVTMSSGNFWYINGQYSNSGIA